MGEIGISPHEFLYELSYWEVLRIIRGYRKRDRLTHQLIAEAVFAAMHTMRDSKGKTVKDFFPMLFEDPDDDEHHNDITDQEMAYLEAEEQSYVQNLIDEFNRQNKPPAPPQQAEAQPNQ